MKEVLYYKYYFYSKKEFLQLNCFNNQTFTLEINDTEYKLNEYVLINNDNIIKNNNEELLIIKLKDINKINNMSYMFDKCSSLISIYCSEILIFRN